MTMRRSASSSCDTSGALPRLCDEAATKPMSVGPTAMRPRSRARTPGTPLLPGPGCKASGSLWPTDPSQSISVGSGCSLSTGQAALIPWPAAGSRPLSRSRSGLPADTSLGPLSPSRVHPLANLLLLSPEGAPSRSPPQCQPPGRASSGQTRNTLGGSATARNPTPSTEAARALVVPRSGAGHLISRAMSSSLSPAAPRPGCSIMGRGSSGPLS